MAAHVLTTLLLIVVTVVSVFLTYNFVMGILESVRKSTSEFLNPTGSMASLQFSSVYANTTHITFRVKNFSLKNLQLDKVYVDGDLALTLNELLLPGSESGRYAVSKAMIAGTSHEVRVVCTDGTYVSRSVEAKG